MNKTPILDIQKVTAGYGPKPIIREVSLQVFDKDFIGIIGPNGGGKTTLLKAILGLAQIQSGHIKINGKPLEKGRTDIGYVPQYATFDRKFPIDVREAVLMGRINKRGLFKWFSKEDYGKVDIVLKQVELSHLANQPLSELSGGQLQRVYIARALVTDPDLLLLDEPTASVDPQIKTNIFELLSQLNEKLAIVMVSHDVNVISSYVKTIGCMNQTFFYHNSKDVTQEMLDQVYDCPVDMIAHGVPHRVLPTHDHHGHTH